VLLPPREGAALSYRADRRQAGGGEAARAPGAPQALLPAAAAAAAAAAPASALDDIFGGGGGEATAAASAASAASAAAAAAASASPLAALLHVPPLHPQHLPAMAACPGISGPPTCDAPEDCDIVVGAAECNAVHPELDDGSVASEAVSHDWAALRVSFCRAELRAELGAGGGGGGSAGAAAGSGARFPRPPPPALGATFALTDIEDELVALPCALIAALRAEGVPHPARRHRSEQGESTCRSRNASAPPA
jgi:hypothetical protein